MNIWTVFRGPERAMAFCVYTTYSQNIFRYGVYPLKNVFFLFLFYLVVYDVCSKVGWIIHDALKLKFFIAIDLCSMTWFWLQNTIIDPSNKPLCSKCTYSANKLQSSYQRAIGVNLYNVNTIYMVLRTSLFIVCIH